MCACVCVAGIPLYSPGSDMDLVDLISTFSLKLQPESRLEKYLLVESHQQGSQLSLEAELGKERLSIYSLLTFLDGSKKVEDV